MKEKFPHHSEVIGHEKLDFDPEDFSSLLGTLYDLAEQQKQKITELDNLLSSQEERKNDFEDSISAKISNEIDPDYDPEYEAASLPARLKMLENLKKNVQNLKDIIEEQEEELKKTENQISLFTEIKSGIQNTKNNNFSLN